MAFSPDGRWALSGSGDNTLKLWEVATGREVRAFSGHTEEVWSVAISPDGRWALSGSGDKTLKLWDFSRGTRYRELEARLEEARKALQAKSDDAPSMRVLGEWYAFRGVWDWAVEFLEKARSGGIKVSQLELGRCYWQKGNLAAAEREFKLALEQKEAPEYYLKLCIQAIEREAASSPTKSQSGSQQTPPKER